MPRSPIDRSLDLNEADSNAAWQRAYANHERVTSEFSQDVRPPDTTCLPAVRPPSAGRGASDATAAWRRWHGHTMPAALTAAEQLCYSVLERARVETLASRDLPGIAHNLADLYPLQPANDFLATLYRLARVAFCGQTDALLEERNRLSESCIAIETQRPRRRSFRQYLTGTPSTPRRTSPATLLQLLDDTLPRARHVLGDGRRFAETISPLVTQLACYISDSAGESLSLSEEPDDKAIIRIDQTNTDTRIPENNTGKSDNRYRIFSRHWDEEIPARALYKTQDAALLRELDTLDKRDARRLAHQLQRRIQAAGLRRWSFDLEEGVLDNRRLSRLLTGDGPARIFRQEQPSRLPEACVTLLVDQSGSMRGRPQQLVLQALDLLVHALDSCRIPCEVLGYTTRFNDTENPLYQSWLAAGAPANPGRLNALRHIVYKPMAQPWRRCRPYLALMLKPDLGKENIDGEALAWASARLLQQPQPRKILLVFSDGTPHDSTTVNSNGKTLLENHLRDLINVLESGPLHLSAIGTSASVGRFYRHALNLHEHRSVAEALFHYMADVLLPSRPGTNMEESLLT